MIEIEHLNKTYNYKKSNAFQALYDISLKINDGELTAIIGRSGAGKTTLLHIIGCIDQFESGSYKIDGTDIASLSDKELSKIRNQKVGIVMQDFALIESYTVLENVKTPLYFAKIKGKKADEMAIAALKLVDMEKYAKQPIKNLSGGQKQRIAIARALVNKPSFILADEPTGALDSKTSSEIMELFKTLNTQGNTVIIITHDPLIANACTRQIEISDGKITSDTNK
ncbi:MAG: ABC transporter ATP-binding protein [Acutalibacteraceae bacterium]